MRTTVNIEDALLRAAQTVADREGTTVTQVIEDALRDALSKECAQARVTFPTSAVNGAGGLNLPPGLDINDTSAVLSYLDALDATS